MADSKSKTTSKRKPISDAALRTRRLGQLAMAEANLRSVENLTTDPDLRRRASVIADGIKVLDGDLRRHLGVKERGAAKK